MLEYVHASAAGTLVLRILSEASGLAVRVVEYAVREAYAVLLESVQFWGRIAAWWFALAFVKLRTAILETERFGYVSDTYDIFCIVEEPEGQAPYLPPTAVTAALDATLGLALFMVLAPCFFVIIVSLGLLAAQLAWVASQAAQLPGELAQEIVTARRWVRTSSRVDVSSASRLPDRYRRRAEKWQLDSFRQTECMFCWEEFTYTAAAPAAREDGKSSGGAAATTARGGAAAAATAENCSSCSDDDNATIRGSDSKPLRMLPCGHMFDEPCWELWVASRYAFQRQTCPICQKAAWGPYSSYDR